MMLLDQIVERRLAEAERRGELSNLPGAGRPLRLEDLSGVPRELRTSYIMLKNAGFVPPELHTRREIRKVEDLLENCGGRDEPGRRRLQARLSLLFARLESERKRPVSRTVLLEYEHSLAREKP